MKISRRAWIAVAVFSLCGSVNADTVPKGGRPPVLLINGWSALCTNTDNTTSAASSYFGQMSAFLGSNGYTVLFFNTCAYGDVSIETLAANLNSYLAGLNYTDGTPVTQVDIIAFSLGGLVARAYLSGKGQTSGSFAPPANPKVRKLVLIATPNFGSFQAEATHGIQESQMAVGSQLQWDLATWNQNQDDLRGVDALAIVGNAGILGAATGGSDGFVSVTSASLGFARTDIRTRLVPYCHISSGTGPASFPLSCQGQGIASIDNASHNTAQILGSFLMDDPHWQNVGQPPSKDNFFLQNGGLGGVILTLKGADDTYFKDIINVGYDCTRTCFGHLGSGPSASVASVYSYDVVLIGQHTFVMAHADTSSTSKSGTVLSGETNVFAFKLGPAITGVQSSNSTGLPGLTVAGNSTITVTGTGFTSSGTTQLFASGTPLAISQLTDSQITAFLPSGFNGLVPLKVVNGNGQHTINILTASPSPVMTVTSVTNAGSGAPGAIAPGEMIAIKGSLLGPTTGVSFSVNSSGNVDTTLAATRVLFGSTLAPITYTSATQINAIVPYEVAGQTQVDLKVEYQGVQSAPTTLQVVAAAPGAFTFNQTGTGQAIAFTLNGAANGPANPALKGGIVAIYFTGGGQTNPPGVTGSVNGSALKLLTQDLFVTVGGKAVISAAAAAAPTFVDGVQQLNIQLGPNTPSGVQPLSISVGGLVSPSTATLTVQ